MPSNEQFDLTGKVAVVTGASRGIGEAIAKNYAAAGARVVLSSRKLESLEKVAEEIKTAGGEAAAIACHTGDEEMVQTVIESSVEKFGGVDIVVNNAATNPHFGPIMTAEGGHWDKTFDVNVKGYFYVAKYGALAMKKRGGGKIINIASIAGKAALPGMGVYCASKAAVLMLTESLAVELADSNIQVNAIAPGFIKTRFSSALWQNPKINDAIVSRIPQNRMAEPQELTGIALYLASSASSFTTGSTFLIDGGQHAAGQALIF